MRTTENTEDTDGGDALFISASSALSGQPFGAQRPAGSQHKNFERASTLRAAFVVTKSLPGKMPGARLAQTTSTKATYVRAG
jgi:hypothetical protein